MTSGGGEPAGQIGLDDATDILLGLDGAPEQEIALVRRADRALHLRATCSSEGRGAGRDVDRLIGVGDAVGCDAGQVDDVAARTFGDGDDMVGGLHQPPDQAEIAPLVVERGVGQPQRHQVVQRVEVRPRGDVQGKRIGPVRQVRRGRQADRRAQSPGVEAAIGATEQVGRIVERFMMGQTRGELACDVRPLTSISSASEGRGETMPAISRSGRRREPPSPSKKAISR